MTQMILNIGNQIGIPESASQLNCYSLEKKKETFHIIDIYIRRYDWNLNEYKVVNKFKKY